MHRKIIPVFNFYKIKIRFIFNEVHPCKQRIFSTEGLNVYDTVKITDRSHSLEITNKTRTTDQIFAFNVTGKLAKLNIILRVFRVWVINLKLIIQHVCRQHGFHQFQCFLSRGNTKYSFHSLKKFIILKLYQTTSKKNFVNLNLSTNFPPSYVRLQNPLPKTSSPRHWNTFETTNHAPNTNRHLY